MKIASMLSMTWSLAALFAACSCLSVATSNDPVTRVVNLMKSLSAKLENDMKKEEDLFETYACWAKKLVSEKEASNTKASRKIEELETYVADINSGKIEFTTERTDLEKELAGLNADIEIATAQRESEHEEFKAAEAEMEKAISALQDAIWVLGNATKNSLLAVKTTVNMGFQERVVAAQSLERAVRIGQRYLSAGNARFLEHLLLGEVPDVDWKKLNRKATFKTKYTKRSGDIQKTLADLLSTFTSNLGEAKDKEQAAVTTHASLMSAKNDAKGNAESALTAMAEESGARSMSKSDAEAEINFLNEQVKTDKQAITDTENALKTKTTEYKTRKELQQGELAAFSEAISILHSDDARDLFHKSFASQGYMLTQIGQHSANHMLSGEQIVTAAAAPVLAAVRKSGDLRLTALATRIALGAGARDFSKVISAIDNMLGILKREGESDSTKKQACEADHERNSQSVASDSREMDSFTQKVRKNKDDIAQVITQIGEANQTLIETKAALAEATKQREAEHEAWKESDADDAAAAGLVSNAKSVLESFYSKNSLALAQQAKQAPETWDGPYKGATTEKNGIISILGMVHEDILKDQKAAKIAEDAAKSAYDAAVISFNTDIGNLNSQIDGFKTRKGTLESDIATYNGRRLAFKNSIQATLQVMKDAAPGCDFMTVNFEVRKANRDAEKAGLEKAKTILQAAHEAP